MTGLIASEAETYAAQNTTPFDAVVDTSTRERLPNAGMMSGLAEARLLEALLVVGGARRVLEIAPAAFVRSPSGHITITACTTCCRRSAMARW